MSWNEVEMRSEWFNLVLPPIRRKHRIKSFGPHFCLVVYKLISIGMSLEWGMTLKWQEWSSDTKKIDMEWRDDFGMKAVQELRVLPWLENESSFLLILSFRHHFYCSEWSKNGLNESWMNSLHCKFPFHVILRNGKWCRNDRMRRNERVFFEGRKNWIFWRLPFCHHSTIPTSFDVDNSFVPGTILGWAGMRGKWGQNDLIQCFLL